MSKKLLGTVAATALAGLIVAGSAAPAFAKGAKFKCEGGNSCKGTSSCKSAQNTSCKGKNACKGQGWTMAKNEAACTKAKEKNGGAAPAADAPKDAAPAEAK